MIKKLKSSISGVKSVIQLYTRMLKRINLDLLYERRKSQTFINCLCQLMEIIQRRYKSNPEVQELQSQYKLQSDRVKEHCFLKVYIQELIKTLIKSIFKMEIFNHQLSLTSLSLQYNLIPVRFASKKLILPKQCQIICQRLLN